MVCASFCHLPVKQNKIVSSYQFPKLNYSPVQLNKTFRPILITMMAAKRVQQWATFARTWHIFDCKWQDPYESASIIKKYLMGLHKPIYHPMNDCGDVVVCINSKDIALRGDEWRKRAYFHHTGYPRGGATWTLAWELHSKDKTMIVRKAVYRALQGNLQRRHTMERLLIFPGEAVPADIMQNVTNQIRQLRLVPTRLDHIPEEEVKTFPKVMDYPEDYVLK